MLGIDGDNVQVGKLKFEEEEVDSMVLKAKHEEDELKH